MTTLIETFADFRAKLRDLFPFRADATMNLIDAITGNLFAKSPVQLCLSALFPRKYSSIYDAVDNFSAPTKEPEKDASEQRRERRLERMRVIAEQVPPLVRRAYYLFCVGKTKQPQPFAPTLKDRALSICP